MSTVTVAELTVPQKILLAACKLENSNQSPFSAEALIVAAWHEYPKTFGLKGYSDLYPDSNKILSYIMGERGLAKRGWLAKLGQKLYALTKEGRRAVSHLVKEEDGPESSKQSQLGKDKEKFLKSVITSSAFRKFEGDRKSELTFADASRFWEITENIKGEAVNERFQHVDQMFYELDKIVAKGDVELSSGRIVTADDLIALRNIHHYMQDRFERVLNLLRNQPPRKK